MAKPLLQVALDNFTISEALESTRILAPELDIIEVGTILCLSSGSEAIEVMNTLYPDNIIVADLKIVDAGGELAGMACDKGADWVTVMCNAADATKVKAMEAAEKRGGEMQVELFGNWTYEQAETWKKLGLKQVIYHQSRDALNSGGSWGTENMTVVKKLADIGLEVSVTGGLTKEVIQLFKGIPVKSFIVGRNLRNADDPATEARAYQDEIAKYWT
ncbi:MAG: 3-keto-L-gulonate-6-phosphate decarboxylase UlaD [Spirochaetaceae bacterium]|nr:3-keto-L-gulonate-6-phosphate decarboxylase UlaD [Spirochaetaceae bacterium]MDT8299444.1 3-keto-L-gulonate-6-phosphate decarboxylase UlaD [Spirochaetaceae bacterium]